MKLKSRKFSSQLISHPLKVSLQRWFQPMGFKLQVETNSPAILKAADISFSRFGVAQPVDTPDFTFRLFEHEVDDGPPDDPIFRMEGNLLYQTTGRDSTLVADLGSGFATGYFSPTVVSDTTFFRWHFLELAFFMMLESRGLMGVHGAALVKNGTAILLRAPGGSGKTTLAYAGARSRFRALAEDVVWLDADRNLWWGMPWSFHLLPDAKRLFPELEPYAPVLQTNGEMKLEVNLEDVRRDSTTVSARPGAVVLLERVAGGKSRLEPVETSNVYELWQAGQTGLEMKLPHHAGYIEKLLNRPVYRLYFGDDIEASLKLLDTLVE